MAHPSIDAAIQLRNANELKAGDIQFVALKVHPLVLNLMGKLEPHTGLEGKFSVVHAVAVPLVTGRGGEQAFTDQAVNDPVVVAMRKMVTAMTVLHGSTGGLQKTLMQFQSHVVDAGKA